MKNGKINIGFFVHKQILKHVNRSFYQTKISIFEDCQDTQTHLCKNAQKCSVPWDIIIQPGLKDKFLIFFSTECDELKKTDDQKNGHNPLFEIKERGS